LTSFIDFKKMYKKRSGFIGSIKITKKNYSKQIIVIDTQEDSLYILYALLI